MDLLTTTKWRYARSTLVSGLLCMLCCCVWGLLRDTAANHWDRMFVGGHHQFAHNGELLIACAFVFPFLALSRRALAIAFWALQLGTWANPIAYVVMSCSGQSLPMVGNHHGGKEVPTGPWGGVAAVILVGVCVPGILVGTGLLLAGVVRNHNLAQSLRDAQGIETKNTQ